MASNLAQTKTWNPKYTYECDLYSAYPSSLSVYYSPLGHCIEAAQASFQLSKRGKLFCA